MAEKTSIGWTHHTLNFWEGCTKVSPGCDSCYAEARNKRFSGGKNWGPGAPRRERLVKALEEASKLDRKAKQAGERRRVFVNSLSDFFDNEVDDAWRAYALGVMRANEHLDFLVLTKRIGNVAKMIEGWHFWPVPNVWLGATMVNQEEASRDMAKLLAIPAAKHWVSYEPALGEVHWNWTVAAARASIGPSAAPLDWLIVGGESGHAAREFPVSWARSAIEHCRAVGIACFVKQLGARPFIALQDGFESAALTKGKWDEPADWPEWLRVQEFPR